MDWQDCKLISISLRNHKVYLLENKNGSILGKFSYPATMAPVALALHDSRQKACLVLTENNEGILYILHLEKMKSYRLPLSIPAPTQISITTDFKSAYFVTASSTLYHLDIASLSCKPLVQGEKATCVGISAHAGYLYTIWENDGEGFLASFDANGTLLSETNLAGIPTNLYVHNNELIVTFTDSQEYGEGIVFIQPEQPPRYITIQKLDTPYSPHIYPCGITLNKSQDTMYIIHEDGCAISIVNLTERTVTKTFTIGRSITNLYLLPDERFAIATSNMFADLTLVDLINAKLLAVSDAQQEFSHLLAII